MQAFSFQAVAVALSIRLFLWHFCTFAVFLRGRRHFHPMGHKLVVQEVLQTVDHRALINVIHDHTPVRITISLCRRPVRLLDPFAQCVRLLPNTGRRAFIRAWCACTARLPFTQQPFCDGMGVSTRSHTSLQHAYPTRRPTTTIIRRRLCLLCCISRRTNRRPPPCKTASCWAL